MLMNLNEGGDQVEEVAEAIAQSLFVQNDAVGTGTAMTDPSVSAARSWRR